MEIAILQIVQYVGYGAIIYILSIVIFLYIYLQMLHKEYEPWIFKLFGRRMMLYVQYVLLEPLIKLGSADRRDKREREQALEKADMLATQEISKYPIFFIGSSTFTYWTQMKKDFGDFYGKHVVNAAFGGSRTWDVNNAIDELVIEYKPKVIVYYCGTNDLTANKTPDEILKNVQTFVNEIHRKISPETAIIYLGITLTPLHRFRGKTRMVIETNKTLEKWIQSPASGENTVWCPPLKITGNNADDDSNVFLMDSHHLNKKGHRKIGKKLFPFVQNAFQKAYDVENKKEWKKWFDRI